MAKSKIAKQVEEDMMVGDVPMETLAWRTARTAALRIEAALIIAGKRNPPKGIKELLERTTTMATYILTGKGN